MTMRPLQRRQQEWITGLKAKPPSALLTLVKAQEWEVEQQECETLNPTDLIFKINKSKYMTNGNAKNPGDGQKLPPER